MLFYCNCCKAEKRCPISPRSRSCACQKWSAHGLNNPTIDLWWIGCVVSPNYLDHGNLLAASLILSREHGIILSIKFCLGHLNWNIVSRFSILKLDILDLCGLSWLGAMQSSPTINIFAVATNRMTALPDPKLRATIFILFTGQCLEIREVNWRKIGCHCFSSWSLCLSSPVKTSTQTRRLYFVWNIILTLHFHKDLNFLSTIHLSQQQCRRGG